MVGRFTGPASNNLRSTSTIKLLLLSYTTAEMTSERSFQESYSSSTEDSHYRTMMKTTNHLSNKAHAAEDPCYSFNLEHSQDTRAEEDFPSPCSQYRDFSSFPDVEIPWKTKGGVSVPFSVKLFHLLEHIDLNEPALAKIISWQPHGRCFMTHDAKKMEQENVLSRCFLHKNFTSFRRQLNLWGFKRITKGPDQGAYYHELFLRSKPYLCRAIERLPTRKPGGAAIINGFKKDLTDNWEAEPRFCNMPPLPPSLAFITSEKDAIKMRIGTINIPQATEEAVDSSNEITHASTPFESTSSSSPKSGLIAWSDKDSSEFGGPPFFAGNLRGKESPDKNKSTCYDNECWFLPCTTNTTISPTTCTDLHQGGALLTDNSSIVDFQQQRVDFDNHEDEEMARKYGNMTPYPMHDSPPVTMQELIEIVQFLKKLK